MPTLLAHDQVGQENNYGGSLERLTKAYFISNEGTVESRGASCRMEVHTDDGVDTCKLMPKESERLKVTTFAGFRT